MAPSGMLGASPALHPRTASDLAGTGIGNWRRKEHLSKRKMYETGAHIVAKYAHCSKIELYTINCKRA